MKRKRSSKKTKVLITENPKQKRDELPIDLHL